MRRLVLTAVVALTGGSAMASSIEYINGTQTSNGSFVRLDCAGCQPVKDTTTPQGYAIPSIEPGTQHTEMREVEGKRTLVRTEAWLGGAPVTFMSTNPAWMPQETSGTAIATYDEGEAGTHPQDTAATPAGVDMTTTTAATKTISAANAAASSTASASASSSASAITTPDFQDFKLRSN
ncbi:MAG: plant virulence effector HPE1-like domain-containing protein [Agrobacterium sp.]|nr:plant virulence effector HPE1-like domain-containing protein [Agrobacterium sp.]